MHKIYHILREFWRPPLHLNAHYQSLNSSESTPPQMGGEAHPAVVTSNLDLRHETGDFGSNSILEILQLQYMVMIRYKIYMRVLDDSLFTIARYRYHHHVA